MEAKSGKISVTTENIFPVIRQWLYEDKDIFVRELVSNCADAIAKHRRLVELGKAEKEPDNADYKITVTYDDDNKTISFEDNGIGMTENEVEKYINQIAFSGALDFVTKYQQESTDKTGIIGHFGLGFYSAFMVADEVTIDTKSFIEIRSGRGELIMREQYTKTTHCISEDQIKGKLKPGVYRFRVGSSGKLQKFMVVY